MAVPEDTHSDLSREGVTLSDSLSTGSASYQKGEQDVQM